MQASKLGSRIFPFALLLGACNVHAPTGGTGGVSLDGGAPNDGGASQEPPIRGWVVVNTDYASSIMSLLSPAGEVTSPVFIGSRSAKPGLSAAFDGDVVVPTTRMPGDEVLVIDRLHVSVLTWVNLETSDVRAQLSVATGFNSNPHDYVPYTAKKAFVTRYEPNLAAGKKPFDGGNDVLVIDPSEPAITASIDMTPAMDGAPSAFYPRPSSAAIIGGKLRVFLEPSNDNFTEYADARIVTVDPDSNELGPVLALNGLVGCGGPSPSPDGTKLAIACSGRYHVDPSTRFADSAIVLFAVGDELVEQARFTAKDLGTEQISQVVWASPSTLLVSTTGRFSDDNSEAVAQDAVRLFDVEASSLEPEPLLQTKKTPFSLGPVRCDVPRRTCFATDAETDGGVVHQLSIDDAGRATVDRRIEMNTGTALPPRGLGAF